MQNSLIQYSASSFDWTNSWGTQEASALGIPPARGIPGDLLEGVAMDIGFEVVGKHRTVLFTFIQTALATPGGEMVGWEFASKDAEYTITIFND